MLSYKNKFTSAGDRLVQRYIHRIFMNYLKFKGENDDIHNNNKTTTNKNSFDEKPKSYLNKRKNTNR